MTDTDMLAIWLSLILIYILIRLWNIWRKKKKQKKTATGTSKTAAVSPRTKKTIDAAKEKAVKDTLKKFEPEKKASEKKSEPKKSPEKTAVSRVRTDAEEKNFEKPKETPAKTTVSRVKTDPAFSDKKPSEKPKTAPKEKSQTQKPRTDMETETLLRVEKGKKDYWKCYYCGTENEKTAHRCVVCAQEKPPVGT